MANQSNVTQANIWSFLKDAFGQDVCDIVISGAPTSGTSGTGVGICGPGSICRDITNFKTYLNTNTKASPTWSQIPTAGTLSLELAQDAVVAGTTQTQAGATALTGQIVRVGTVAVTGDGVRLPTAVAGLIVTVHNNGALPMKVYGAGTDTINSIATATGLFQGVGAVATYICTVAGNWLVSVASLFGSTPVAITADGAINPRAPQTYIITKGSAAALTMAAPTVTIDDGVTIVVTSDSAFAHAITFTGNILDSGSALVASLTFNPNKGASATLMASNARVKLISGNGASAA